MDGFFRRNGYGGARIRVPENDGRAKVVGNSGACSWVSTWHLMRATSRNRVAHRTVTPPATLYLRIGSKPTFRPLDRHETLDLERM